MVTLPNLDVALTTTVAATDGKTTQTLTDVAIGDVILCGGRHSPVVPHPPTPAPSPTVLQTVPVRALQYGHRADPAIVAPHCETGQSNMGFGMCGATVIASGPHPQTPTEALAALPTGANRLRFFNQHGDANGANEQRNQQFNTFFGAIFALKNRSFDQDRLGTNRGKVEAERHFVQAGRAPP